VTSSQSLEESRGLATLVWSADQTEKIEKLPYYLYSPNALHEGQEARYQLPSLSSVIKKEIPTSGLTPPRFPNTISSTSAGKMYSLEALQAHSAAVQHELAICKISIRSLQQEHDKLLALFSKSTTRASAFEKQHIISNNEVIRLSEEKSRLEARVTELICEAEELSRGRDEYRQASV
jgi:chromosome segregation ATPase